MSLNPQFQQIGETFVKQYYAIFDGERDGREKLVNFYHNLTFTKIARAITTVDCQPTFDGGVLINILGQLKMDEDPVHGFSQTFVLKPMSDSFFIQHDSFRLVIHNH
ncbi:probable nuclear transport factor 2 isoform X2 [Homarus americanus]|uniref:probable nuclear transport factor 2 isoform X2 n=1 Tax=Homarus americanus TaxID=6706 RepID=UPI001C4544EE|nr:probable nuclear transport factor 2 isoform X2 [Homarus americanus]